jgi:Ca2+-binding EF-hand superfamily protein
MNEMRGLVKRFDKDGSGNLNAEELANLIANDETSKCFGETSAPNEEEALWIVQVAGKKKAPSKK